MQDAQDHTQDTFVRAFRKLHHFDDERSFGPWIRKIAANLCLTTLQRQKNNLADINEQPQKIISTERNPEEIIQENYKVQQIQKEILNLTPKYRIVIILRHYNNMSYQEISDTLELPISDVKSHLFRARKQLAKRLQNELE